MSIFEQAHRRSQRSAHERKRRLRHLLDAAVAAARSKPRAGVRHPARKRPREARARILRIYDRYPWPSRAGVQIHARGLKQTAAALESRGVGFLDEARAASRGHRESWPASSMPARWWLTKTISTSVARGGGGREKPGREALSGRCGDDSPARITDKEEWGAYTIRPQITRLLPECFPRVLSTLTPREGGSPSLASASVVADLGPLELPRCRWTSIGRSRP